MNYRHTGAVKNTCRSTETFLRMYCWKYGMIKTGSRRLMISRASMQKQTVNIELTPNSTFRKSMDCE